LRVCSCTLFLLALSVSPVSAEPLDEATNDRDAQSEQPKPVRDDDVDLESATPDPAPTVPSVLERTPRESRVTVVEQAGVGGPLAYGSATVLEVGGAGSLSVAGRHMYMRLAPFVAWFVLDGVSLQYMHEIYINKDGSHYRVATAPMLGASVHFRVNDRLLVATGPEWGPLYNGDAWGVLGRIKLGLDILVGRSGVLHPNIYGSWSSDDTIDPGGNLVLGEHFSAGFDIAYGAMF
jgi:hypothetical protein